MRSDFTYVDEPVSHLSRRREIAALHPEVRALQGRNPWSAAWIAALVAAQIAVASLAPAMGGWLLLASALLFGAFVNHALYVLVHECTHALVFRSRKANRVAAIACDLALAIPSAMGFMKFHLLHHRYLGQYEMDPDIVSHAEARLVGNRWWRKALWVALLPISQALRPAKLQATRGIALWDRWVVLNLLLVVAADAAVVVWLGPAALGYLLLSTVFALGLHPLGGRWIQEHYVTEGGQDTYSYYGPLNRLCFNMGYHNEHHDFPAVPWNRLPQLRRMAPEFYDTLKFYDSWSAVLRRFIFDPSLSGYSRIVHPATPVRVADGSIASGSRSAPVVSG
jgi:sphingolipid delta-4 desaturase